jgi:transposase
MVTRYKLSWQMFEKIESLQLEHELEYCFVIINNVPTTGDTYMESARILHTYNCQYSVESDFAFLKDL